MSNSGVYPLDTTTNVGKTRLTLGDTISVAFDPVQVGLQNYTLFSDAELEFFLSNGGDSPTRASGRAFLSLAGAAAQQAESIKDYDLAVDRRQKAEQLRLQAAEYFRLADQADAAGTTGFQIVGTGLQYPYWAELAEYPYISQSGLIV